MNRSFAIGDIHGCSRTLLKMLERIGLQASDTLYCLGDYIDRGPDSKGVIDTILSLREQGFAIHTLRGNHEQLLLDAAESWMQSSRWLSNGGDATLKSFGIRKLGELPPRYGQFFSDTVHYLVAGNYIFTHAGLNFKAPDPFRDLDAMLWTRDQFIDPAKLSGKVLVHGHTPVPLDTIRQSLELQRINLDGGCVYRAHGGYGQLVALHLETKELLVEKNID
jgi:serine/threonine protein phosphatase 1